MALTPEERHHWETIEARQLRISIGNHEMNLQRRDADGWTHLHKASVCTSRPEVIATLIEADANPNARCLNGLTPLHLAAQSNGYPEVITELLKYNNVNARDKTGNTPLHLAALGNPSPEVIMALIEANPDYKLKNIGEQTPFGCLQQNDVIMGHILAVGTPAFKVYWALHDAQFD